MYLKTPGCIRSTIYLVAHKKMLKKNALLQKNKFLGVKVQWIFVLLLPKEIWEVRDIYSFPLLSPPSPIKSSWNRQ